MGMSRLITHDEGSCWAPKEIRPSIILSHWGRKVAHPIALACQVLPVQLQASVALLLQQYCMAWQFGAERKEADEIRGRQEQVCGACRM